MRLCGSRGFAGPSACVLEKGHQGNHQYGDFATALEDERRKDAARYRWIREHVSDDMQWYLLDRSVSTQEEFDAAIDAAILKTPNLF